ncbi:N-acetylmuramoyl-L-alanine amidase [uncultured Clostridium sp.]|uniref:N-acetylmuramoyl-L-alanine amidase n=1 Tax=uncultured Clostridium sp. TaxID=59620 RepID=UPI002603213E|nr:N-acetylmuramoyl-L-alanine amidase [uncultured Clostridium sp.]
MKFKLNKGKQNIIRWCVLGIIIFSGIILGFNIRNMSIVRSNEKAATIRKSKNTYGIDITSDAVDNIYKELKVVENEFEWSGELEGGNIPNTIYIHHSVQNIEIQNIHTLHLKNGWAGMGYHYFIDKAGIIYKGRDDDKIGAQAKNNNINSLGVCLQGDFEEDILGDVQRDSLLKLLRYLTLKNKIVDIRGHEEVTETLCPGENISVEELEKSLDSIMYKEFNVKKKN